MSKKIKIKNLSDEKLEEFILTCQRKLSLSKTPNKNKDNILKVLKLLTDEKENRINSTKKVFISYAHENIDSAKRLYSQLKPYPNIAPWYDKECLLPGENWQTAITKAIKSSDYFIVLISKNSTTKRGFVQRELKVAFEVLGEFPVGRIYLIPIRIEECEIHCEDLNTIQYVDFFPNWDEGFKKLLQVLKPNSVTDISKKMNRNLSLEKRSINDIGIKSNKLSIIDTKPSIIDTKPSIIDTKPIIKIIGVGDTSIKNINNLANRSTSYYDTCNSINISSEYIAMNTDLEALSNINVSKKIQLGPEIANGFKIGLDPEVGRDAALESAEDIRLALENSHLVCIIASLDDGVGIGSTPVIAKISNELGALTIVVSVMPFSFKGKTIIRIADEGICALKQVADTLIKIPFDKYIPSISKNTSVFEFLQKVDEMIINTLKCIIDLIVKPSSLNEISFMSLREILNDGCVAFIGIGNGKGDKRAIEAVNEALSHRFLEEIVRVRKVLVNISFKDIITVYEMNKIYDRIQEEEIMVNTEIILVDVFDESLDYEDEIRVTLLVIGDDKDANVNSNIGNMNYRNKIRDTTPADTAIVNNYDEPTFIRSQKSLTMVPTTGPNLRGYKGMLLDNDDLDVPSFLRKKHYLK